MAKRELLQLAEHYDPPKHDVAGWFISEKLDGTRCFWDGGLSRGLPTDTIPWASIIDPKTGEKKAKIKPVATGLWSRYGNPIIAPDAFLNLLPCCPLDGELWAGRGNFQLCRSICGGDTPDPRFTDKIVYAVYSSPPLSAVFGTGEIKNANMVRAMDFIACEQWIRYQSAKPSKSHNTQHTNFLEYNHRGLTVNAGYLEHCNEEYADQLCLYGWLLGEKPGDEYVVGMIEEIVSKPAEPAPLLRVANHRARVKADYQQKLLDRVGRCWEAITSGNIFADLTPDENASRREVLEDMALSLGKTAGAYDDWFNEVTRPQFKR